MIIGWWTRMLLNRKTLFQQVIYLHLPLNLQSPQHGPNIVLVCRTRPSDNFRHPHPSASDHPLRWHAVNGRSHNEDYLYKPIGSHPIISPQNLRMAGRQESHQYNRSPLPSCSPMDRECYGVYLWAMAHSNQMVLPQAVDILRSPRHQGIGNHHAWWCQSCHDSRLGQGSI